MRHDVTAIDLRPFLPRGWTGDLAGAAYDASPVRREGGGPGSLHLGDGAGLDYRTHGRAELRERVTWIEKAYRLTGELLALATGETWNEDLFGIDGPHAITLNVLSPDSAKNGLEWHRDGGDVAWTVIFSNGVWTGEAGGRFLWHDGSSTYVQPLATPGVALALETARYPHAVEAPARAERITVMFAYTAPGLTREKNLTEYLGDWKD